MKKEDRPDEAAIDIVERGKRLASARNLKGLTQQRMADLLGVKLQTYQNYEYGKRDMKGTSIMKVCAILGCSPDWILGTTDEGMVLPDDDYLLSQIRARMTEDSNRVCIDELTRYFQLLNEKGRNKVIGYAKDLSKVSEYIN